jgi:ribosomal protein S18 acetylase RimI-like enzyme
MKIIRCTSTQLDTIYNIETNILPLYLQQNKSRIKKDIDNGYCYGLFENKLLLGYFSFYTDKGLYLNSILILPEHQGLNYSKIIIQYLKQYIILNSLERIWLHVSIRDDITLGLFNKCGFKIKGNTKDFYCKNEDALIMEFK